MYKKAILSRALGVAAAASLVALTACGPSTSSYPTTVGTDGKSRTNPNPDPNAKRETIFGDDGLTLFSWGGDDDANAGGGTSGIPVNSYLWRASLDTISFMPVQSADPFGGTIITDWHANPEVPNERFKLNIYILDSRLRADGVKVSPFRQVQNENGQWVDAPVDPNLGPQLENAILTRARQLRIASSGTS